MGGFSNGGYQTLASVASTGENGRPAPGNMSHCPPSDHRIGTSYEDFPSPGGISNSYQNPLMTAITQPGQVLLLGG